MSLPVESECAKSSVRVRGLLDLRMACIFPEASVLEETADTKSESIICVAKIVESVTYVELMDMWVLSGNNEDMKSASYTLARAIQARHLVVFYNCSLVNYTELSSPSTGGAEEPTVSIGYTTVPTHLIGTMDEEQAYRAQREGDEELLTGYRINFGCPRHIPRQHISLKVHRSAKVRMEAGRLGTVAVPGCKGEGDTGKKGEGRGRCFWLAGGAWSKTTTAMRETPSNFFNKTESTFRSVEARLPTPPSQHRTRETTVPVVVDLHMVECIVGRGESSVGMSGELLTAVVTLPGLFSWNQKPSFISYVVTTHQL
ncbi:hypothetical protein JB92DRAFT_2826819 [Gautieria morchelliformis]|nr:hypothetical protein JB92DRAFT_2826819 [Gautieria morchelliformis]